MLKSKILESSFDSRRLDSLMDRIIATGDRSLLPQYNELKQHISNKNAAILARLEPELKNAFPNSKIATIDNGLEIYFDDKFTSFKLVPDVDLVKVYYPNKRRMHSEIEVDSVVDFLNNELNSFEPLR